MKLDKFGQYWTDYDNSGKIWKIIDKSGHISSLGTVPAINLGTVPAINRVTVPAIKIGLWGAEKRLSKNAKGS